MIRADRSFWTTARTLLAEYARFTLVAWAVLLVFMWVVVTGVSIFNTIQVSGWDYAGQVAHGFAVGTGAALAAVTLPRRVTHAQTRRSYAIQAGAVTVLFAALLSALFTVGYATEAAVYGLLGWPQELGNPHLFNAPDQYALVFAEFWMTLGVWTMAGAMVAAGFYRRGVLGVALLPLGLGAVAVTEMAVRGSGPLAGLPELALNTTFVTAAAFCAGAFLLAAAVSWAVVRDIPIRNKTA